VATPNASATSTLEELQRETRVVLAAWVATTAFAIAATWLWIVLARPENAWTLSVQAVGFLTVPGKYVVFAGLTPGAPLGPWGLSVVGLIADTWLALALATLLGPLGKLRRVGPWLRRAHERAAEALESYPRLRRMAFWGVTLFVFLPLPGTGAIGGTFAGQLLGLSRIKTVLAIALGSTLTLAAFAGLAQFVGARAEQILANPWVSITSALVLVAFVWVAYRRAKVVLSQR
jgi:uncharacterized membrane protein